MAPAEGDKFADGLEHAEFVINGSLEGFKNRFSDVKFVYKERTVNPELILIFNNNANVKFHLYSIDKVLDLQRNVK